MSRKIAREYAYKLVFEYLFNNAVNEKTYDIFTGADLDEGDKKYLNDVYLGVIKNYAKLSETIGKYSSGFAISRIYKTDLAALLVAVYEMTYMRDEIPLSVSINEAVLLVKHYSTEKSHSFVNGILSSVYKEITDNGTD